MYALDWTKLWVLRDSATLVGEERWAIEWPWLWLLERVHLLLEAVANLQAKRLYTVC